MRKVYTPPSSGTSWLRLALPAMAVTLVVFLILPLTQMLSSHMQKKRQLSKVDAVAPPPPPPSVEPPPPPPEEEQAEEPKPKLSDAPEPMRLNFDLDVAVGTGGALASLGGEDMAAMAGALTDMAFDVSELDKAPVVMAQVSPRYPPEMRKGKVEGSVVIVFLLDEAGEVVDPRVETSSRREFEAPAVDAVKRWRFKPGMRDGEPVRTFMRLPIRFRMAGST